MVFLDSSKGKRDKLEFLKIIVLQKTPSREGRQVSPKVQTIQSPSTDEWLHKMWFIYTVELVFSSKKEWMDDTYG